MNKFDKLPKEIQEKMLEHQVAQGNIRDPKVFRRYIYIVKYYGGFDWDETPEGHDFWGKVISDGKTEVFFERYPKGTGFEPLPEKVMNVWNDGGTKDPRVVFGKKNGEYLAWRAAETIEDAKSEIFCSRWDNAEEIEEEEIKEVSMEDVAKAMNIPVDKLRIKKD